MEKITVSKVAELRKQANLTQRELALSVGVTESTIRNLENNRNGVEILVRVAKLCTALGCTAQDLVDFD
jgi:transcriptional regulator with XRE-family HTH domain